MQIQVKVEILSDIRDLNLGLLLINLSDDI